MSVLSSPATWNRGKIRAPRAQVSLPASVVTMNAYQYPELADISQTGAKVRGSPLPPRGTVALLRAGELEVLCRVVWVKGEDCGLRFEEAVSPRLLKQLQLEGAVKLETVADSDAYDDGSEAGQDAPPGP